MNNSALKTDRRHHFDQVVLGELTPVRPPTSAERHIAWFAKARLIGYDFITGNMADHQARAYERQEMLDARYPSLG